jgi:hypothetical protein
MSRDPSDRANALKALEAFSAGDPSPAELSELIEAATQAYPIVKPEYRKADVELIKAAERHATRVEPNDVTDVYARLPEGARAWSLRLLATAGTPGASAALATLLQRLDDLPAISWPVLLPLERNPRDPDVLVPALIAAHKNPSFSSAVAMPLLSYAKAGQLGRFTANVASLAESAATSSIEETHRAADQDERQMARSRAGIYLDLLGAMTVPDALPALRAAAADDDYWVSMWGAIGLERQGDEAATQVMDRVAEDPSCRFALHQVLAQINRLDHFPARFANQPALAEAVMVQWLEYPTELGSAPDEIEQLHVEQMQDSSGAADLYVFRFRTHEPHWAAKDGWMIGVAGPFSRPEQPTTRALGMTFSRFDKSADKPLADLVKDIQDLIEEWGRNR